MSNKPQMLPLIKGAEQKKLEDSQEEQNQQQINYNQSDGIRKYNNTLQSPFRFPSDEEVFVFRETEKNRKFDNKTATSKLKIWEKNTASTRAPLKPFRKTEEAAVILNQHENDKNYKKLYNSKDKKLIHEAMDIIRNRSEERNNNKNQKKESILELVEQKKEIFLVEMTLGIVNKEIDNLKETTQEKSYALEQTDKMLYQDQANFQAYLKKNEYETDQAILRAEQEAKEKKSRDQEIKNLNQKLALLRTEETRYKDSLLRLRELRDFLEKLTPSEYIEEKMRKEKQKIEEIKRLYVEKELANQEQEETESNQSHSFIKIGANRQKDSNKQFKKNQVSVKTLEERFKGLYEQNAFQDKMDEWEDEYPLYFEDPSQLFEVFSRMEERNLFLIQMMQDAEQSLEEIKVKSRQNQIVLDQRRNNLRDNKSQLEKQINEIEKKIKQLESKINDNKISTKRDDLSPLKKKILEIYLKFKEELPINEVDTRDTLAVLGAIEQCLEQELKQLKTFPQAIVEQHRREFENERKKDARKELSELIQKQTREKTELLQMRSLQPSKKKTGRNDMARSAFLDRKVKKVEINEENKEDDDKKYFE